MYNHWRKDLEASIKALDSIKNTLLPRLISGKIHSIEKADDHILLLLDTKSGIDYIRENETGLQGIASRVQWGSKAWNTFTIRSERHTGAKTEFAKRVEAIRDGYFYPAFTLQAYFTDRETNGFLSVGIIKTINLYNFIGANPNLVHKNKSDNEFKFVFWEDLTGIVNILTKAK